MQVVLFFGRGGGLGGGGGGGLGGLIPPELAPYINVPLAAVCLQPRQILEVRAGGAGGPGGGIQGLAGWAPCTPAWAPCTPAV